MVVERLEVLLEFTVEIHLMLNWIFPVFPPQRLMLSPAAIAVSLNFILIKVASGMFVTRVVFYKLQVVSEKGKRKEEHPAITVARSYPAGINSALVVAKLFKKRGVILIFY